MVCVFSLTTNNMLLCTTFGSSGTEEEYTELHQLLEDITTYLKDAAELKKEKGDIRKKKEAEDKRKGEEMRKAAMESLASKYVRYEKNKVAAKLCIQCENKVNIGF